MSSVNPSSALKVTRQQLAQLNQDQMTAENKAELKARGGVQGLAALLGVDLRCGLTGEEESSGWAARAAVFGRNVYPSPYVYVFYPRSVFVRSFSSSSFSFFSFFPFFLFFFVFFLLRRGRRLLLLVRAGGDALAPRIRTDCAFGSSLFFFFFFLLLLLYLLPPFLSLSSSSSSFLLLLLLLLPLLFLVGEHETQQDSVVEEVRRRVNDHCGDVFHNLNLNTVYN